MMILFYLVYGLHIALRIYVLLVFVVCVMSFLPINHNNKIVRFMYSLTYPVFDLIKRYIPTEFGGFDMAPLIVLLGVQAIDIGVLELLRAF